MTDVIDLQSCEHCEKQFPVEGMTRMEDGWFCSGCVAEWRETFDACEHSWTPHVNEMSEDGQYCENCCGFVANEDFERLGLVLPTTPPEGK